MVSLGDTVSTYFNRKGGGVVFWVSSDLNSGKKVRVFPFLEGGGGFVLGKLRSELRKESYSFSFWGGILGKLRFELRKESYSFSFSGEGGVLGKVRLGLWEQFQFCFWGGVWNQILEQGCSREFGKKFLEA